MPLKESPKSQPIPIQDRSKIPDSDIERKEERENALDFIAEMMLLKGVKVNEGNNGVILHLDIRTLDSDFAKFCKEQGINFDSESAVKVMKIYTRTSGRREFEHHMKAYESQNNDPTNEALIPKPILYRDFELTEEAQKKFEFITGRKHSGRADLIVMDFVKGEDLALILLREALYRCRPDIDPDDVKKMPIEKMQEEVSLMLGFKMAGGKGKTQFERDVEKNTVEDENAATLYEYLNRNGYVLDQTIIDRLKRTIDTFHSAGVVHRDLHERNIMIEGDPQKVGENTVYIIDFGTAKMFDGSYAPQVTELYSESDRKYRQDERVPRNLAVLARSKESVVESRLREEGEKIEQELSQKRKLGDFAKTKELWMARYFKEEVDDSFELSNVVPEFFQQMFKSQKDLFIPAKQFQFIDFLVTCIQKEKCSVQNLIPVLSSIGTKRSSLENKFLVSDLPRFLRYSEKKEIEKRQNEHLDAT